jgi:hypothetical protein
MKIEMTADEFARWLQGNESTNTKLIDTTIKLRTAEKSFADEQNEHYKTRQKLQDTEYNRDINKRLTEQLTKQIEDPAAGWRKQLDEAYEKLRAFEGKSVVPVASLKNLMAIAMGSPASKKEAIEALRVLTQLTTKEAGVLWDEIRTAALSTRSDDVKKSA